MIGGGFGRLPHHQSKKNLVSIDTHFAYHIIILFLPAPAVDGLSSAAFSWVFVATQKIDPHYIHFLHRSQRSVSDCVRNQSEICNSSLNLRPNKHRPWQLRVGLSIATRLRTSQSRWTGEQGWVIKRGVDVAGFAPRS